MNLKVFEVFDALLCKVTINSIVMVDPGLFGDVQQGQLYLELDAIDVFYRF